MGVRGQLLMKQIEKALKGDEFYVLCIVKTPQGDSPPEVEAITDITDKETIAMVLHQTAVAIIGYDEDKIVNYGGPRGEPEQK